MIDEEREGLALPWAPAWLDAFDASAWTWAAVDEAWLARSVAAFEAVLAMPCAWFWRLLDIVVGLRSRWRQSGCLPLVRPMLTFQ